MATGPSAYLIGKWFDALFNNTSFAVTQVWVKLHVGDPGSAGTANAATETTRKSISMAAASGPTITNDVVVQWPSIAGSQDPTHYSLWDASTGGNFLGSGTITSAAYLATNTFAILAGDFDLALTPAS